MSPSSCHFQICTEVDGDLHAGPCSYNNGGCSHFCLAINRKERACACPSPRHGVCYESSKWEPEFIVMKYTLYSLHFTLLVPWFHFPPFQEASLLQLLSIPLATQVAIAQLLPISPSHCHPLPPPPPLTLQAPPHLLLMLHLHCTYTFDSSVSVGETYISFIHNSSPALQAALSVGEYVV